MWKTLLVACLLVVLSSGCSTSGRVATAPIAQPEVQPHVHVRTRIIDTGCDWTRPIYVSALDVLTDATAQAILAHDEAGAAHCGWARRSK
jgi:hypothetical protein